MNKNGYRIRLSGTEVIRTITANGKEFGSSSSRSYWHYCDNIEEWITKLDQKKAEQEEKIEQRIVAEDAKRNAIRDANPEDTVMATLREVFPNMPLKSVQMTDSTGNTIPVVFAVENFKYRNLDLDKYIEGVRLVNVAIYRQDRYQADKYEFRTQYSSDPEQTVYKVLLGLMYDWW